MRKSWMFVVLILLCAFSVSFYQNYQSGYRGFASEVLPSHSKLVGMCQQQNPGILQAIGCECMARIATSEIEKSIERDRVPIALYKATFGLVPPNFKHNFLSREGENLKNMLSSPVTMFERGLRGCQ
jgi:hypothetical protein